MGLGDRIPDSRCTFLKISFSKLYEDAKNLWIDHFKEASFLNFDKFNIDVNKYLLLEKCGFLIVLAVMHDDNIIGYTVIIADNFLHSKDIHYAKIDAIFITKKYRSLMLIKQLLKYTEDYLKSYDIKYLFISSPVKKKLDKLWVKYDYKPIETLFYKEL
jgi:hypothetical protein